MARDLHLVAPRYHPVMGGIETALRETAARAMAREWNVTVHCLRHDPDLPPEDDHEGVGIRRWDPVWRLGYYTTLFRPEIPEGAVVHLHAFGHVVNDWVLRRHDPARCLLTTHHGITFPTGNPLAWAWHALYRRLHVPKLRRLHRVITVNTADRWELLRRGVPPEQVVAIPNGVPDEAFEGVDPGRPPGEDYVLFLGRLHREKGAADLLRALPEVPHVHAVVAGPDAGDGDRLRQLATDLGVAERVHFPGLVPEEEKRALLASARCLVLPSRHEGQGIVLVEAHAQRTPVVATRVGGVPDVVEDGETGLLVPPRDVDALADAITRILDHPDDAQAMGELGRERAWARYRWRVLADRVVDLYEGAEVDRS